MELLFLPTIDPPRLSSGELLRILVATGLQRFNTYVCTYANRCCVVFDRQSLGVDYWNH